MGRNLIRAGLAAAILACLTVAGGCGAREEEAADGPVQVVPPVIALDVRQGDRAERYLPGAEGRRFVVDADGPPLALSVASEGSVAWVQFLLTGTGPGHDGRGTWVVAEGPGNQVAEWFPGPGTRGVLQAVVWHANGAAVRSPQGEIVVPMPPDIFCPAVVLPPLPPVAGTHFRAEPDYEYNLLKVDWLGRSYFVPITVDPDTCSDPKVRDLLLSAQAELPRHQGLGVAIKRFVEGGGLPRVSVDRYWLAGARLVRADEAGVVVDVRLVGRATGLRRQVQAILRAARDGGRWAIVTIEDMRVLGQSVRDLASHGGHQANSVTRVSQSFRSRRRSREVRGWRA